MDSSKWQTIKTEFSALLDLPENERRRTLSECVDEEIRGEIENLLAAHEKAENFIDTPFFVENDFLANENLIGANIDGYVILEKIGAGGMGAVFLAERRVEDFSQKVALKLIKRGMDTAAVLGRFLIERRILAALEHPNIARLLGGGTTKDGLPYFVMEYVEGVSIKEFCEIHEFETKEKLELFQKVCAAVTHAHQKLVVHRDLKPSNILVNAAGEVKLLDFGIAKLLNPEWNEETATGANFRPMTPAYASPEQMRGDLTTTATDVYSLGVILYELLTGARPFDSKSKSRFELPGEEMADSELSPPSSRVPFFISQNSTSAGETARNQAKQTLGAKFERKRNFADRRLLKGDLDNIVLKAVRRDARHRYQSVREFSEDIGRQLNGLPVTATTDSTAYRFSKFVRRHKQAVGISTFAALLLVAISSIAIWQGLDAVRERDKAQERLAKLRETAKSLMYETRDSLDSVPGTIALRQTLSEKSVDLLNSIYDENGTDSAFFKELADSYEKLGRTQLWEFRDFDKAKTACRKAVEIRRKNALLEPSAVTRKIDLAATLSTLAEIYYEEKDENSLAETRTETEAIRREIAERDPSRQNLSELGQQILGFVGTFKEYETLTDQPEKLREAIAVFQKIIDASGGKNLSPNEKTDLAWTLICRGLAYRKLDDDENALTDFKHAEQLSEAAYLANENFQEAYNFADIGHRSEGEIFERRGDFQAALEIYRHGIVWLKRRENNPAQSRPNYAWRMSNSAGRLAAILLKFGRKSAAENTIAAPWREYSAFLNAETNAASLIYAEEPLKYLTKYYDVANQPEKAAVVWREQIERLQKFLDKNPKDTGFLLKQAEIENRLANIKRQRQQQR